MVLCPELYRRLEERFGIVKVANEGEALSTIQQGRATDPTLAHGGLLPAAPGRRQVQFKQFGEYYRVCCPKCGDSRFRLWINHRVVEFPWLIHCYNEPTLCYPIKASREQLLMHIFHSRPPKHLTVKPGHIDDGVLREVQMPGRVIPLHELPWDHPANDYLANDRHYDPHQLSRQYGLGWCEKADEKFRQAEDRIIVPMFMKGTLVGWQARFIGERNWKASPTKKYYNMPGLPRRLIFYNHDQAQLYPWVVVQEGVADVWSTGPFAMAFLGTLTYTQKRILQFPPFNAKPIVFMGDADAYDDNRHAVEELRKNHPIGIIQVDLPPDTDPGNYSPEANLQFIHEAARRQGIRLS